MAMTPEEIRKYDKMVIACHEAAHVLVAAVLGMKVSCWIFENQNCADEMELRTWQGQTQFGCGSAELDKKWSSVICVAGLVGEVWRNDRHIVADEILEGWKDNEIAPSKSDARQIPRSWDQRFLVIDMALSILQEYEAFFDEIVDLLLSNEQVDEVTMAGMCVDYLGENWRSVVDVKTGD